MSKEIAQTVGGKRIAWLIAIVAAFAVFATLSTQWKSSDAALPSSAVSIAGGGSTTPGGGVTYTATFTFNPSGSVAAGGAGTFTVDFDDDLDFVSVGGAGIVAIDAADCTNSGATNVVTCTDDVGEFWTNGTLTFTFTNPFVDATISAVGTCTLTDVTSVSCTDNTVGATVVNPITVTPVTATNALGVAETFVFFFPQPPGPPGYTCASDIDTDFITPECTAADVNLSAGLTLVSGPTATATTGGVNVSVTVINSSAASTGGTVSLDVRALDIISAPTFTSDVGTKIYVSAELRHMSDTANVVLPGQEFNWNVRGSRHTICTVVQDTGIDLNGDGDALDAGEPGVAIQIPGLDLSNIVITNGGGYASTADTDPDFTDVRIFIGDGTATGLPTSSVNAGLAGATCISWVSTDAGDQQINLVYIGADGLNYNVSWDSNNNNNDANGATPGPSNRSLVKEWNRLEDSVITIDGVTQTVPAAVAGKLGPEFTFNITRSVFLNPATGEFEIATGGGDVDIDDFFRGSHTNSAGAKEVGSLAGVVWTISDSSCSDFDGATSGVTTINPNGTIGNTPSIDAFAADCLAGQTATFTFTGCEPGPLGSGTGICVTEIVIITFVQNIAEKKVFLAWAGQRVILEHDWRLPPGDVDGGGSDSVSPLGECAFSVYEQPFVVVEHVKGSGPGNFLPGDGVVINGADHAGALMDVSDSSQTDGEDIVGGSGFGSGLNDMCISRVLFESEDQGQVDIEAFVSDELILRGAQLQSSTQGLNYTKVAFVIYYMKINTINVSLVTQVSKPSHNSSTLADYSPGNPWNASLDDADNAAEWNVSRDILVRGRVTGWFVNSNPSGRAADTSNPLNVLPANRWVMPTDWPLLAGGPADPADGTDAIGTAEQFRPYYDIMFAPNNTRGIALTTPEGNVATQVTTVVVVAGVTNSATAFRVASCNDFAGLALNADLYVGADLTVDFTSCVGGLLTVTNLGATPAAGTPVFIVTGVPFEGPYSTIDIVGLAAQGLGGAALSDFDPNNIRDAALDDGDVDWWDAPMPVAPVSVSIRGTGFIKQVIKSDVYYLGTPNLLPQLYPNPYYIIDIPASPFIPAVVAGGGFHWNTWGNDGPGGDGQGVYRFWQPVVIGTNSEGFGDSFTAAQAAELAAIRTAYGDTTIARDLVVYSDNHGEFMVTANGDFRTDLTACTTNLLAGGKHCKPGDKVGTGTITATVDYPDFRGKHFPVLSNAATVTWTWGGYKDVTVEKGETDQFKYIVFHGMDRDGFCSPLTTGAVLLHPLLSGHANDTFNGNPAETIDFLIDSGEGIIVNLNLPGSVNDGKQFATGVKTFSTALNDPAVTGVLEFPLSSLAATGAVDECQAWIKVSNSLLGILNILVIAHDDEGNIGFDRIIDLTNTTSYTLNFRWSLITWAGADAIPVNDAIKGTGTSGKNPGGNDISASVTAIYGWDAAAQQWLGFFPSGVNVPGANDLVTLETGQAYWIAITGPSSVTWTIASNVN